PEAILLLDEQFHPVWLNTSARKTLGIEPEMLAGTDFRELMPAIDWTQIEHWATDTRFFSENSSLIIGDRTIYCGVNITSSLMELNKRAFSVNIKKQEQVLVAVNALSGNRASYTFNDLSSINPTMLKAISIARRFASYDGNVLIEGEIGTGKEIFAQAIHNASTRFDSPYVTINCAALPRAQVEGELFGYEKGFAPGSREEGYPGKLELANGGTVFLSEIAELPLEYQAELLQVVQNRIVRRVGALQDKELDIRLIVASSRNMRHEVDSGRFRQDLFTSLNVLRLDIVPLRNRPEDIGYLSQRILDYFNDRYPNQHKSMTESFKKILFGYHWPGNTRELQNCIECAFYASEDEDTLGEDLLVNISPMTVRQQSWQNPTREASQPGAPSPLESELNHGLEVNRYPESELGKVTSEASWNGTNTPDIELWDTAEREGIIAALTKARGDVGKAADALNMSRATLYRRIHQFHIDARQIRRMNS
ncbi:MAG: sigma 54-interacting transcriptional regulator, partial [Coriobacteriales bacterium]|nr:sigma 54-interacting transcriptional regulator [Coriobacteriales bacterium]